MRSLILALWHDENGFILSAELVLIGTIAVLSLVVGLSVLASAINTELEDCAQAFGSFDQGGSRYGDHHRRGGLRDSSQDAPDLVGWTPDAN